MEKKFIVAQTTLATAIAQAHLDFAEALKEIANGGEATAPAKAEKKPAKKEPVVEVEADEADEEGIDLDAMDLKQLKKFAKENDIDLGEKRITANTARKLILEALEAEAEEEEEEDIEEDEVDVDADEDGEDDSDDEDEEEDEEEDDEEESEDGYTEEELKELSEEELLELAEHYEIKPSYKGKGKAKKLKVKELIASILEAQEEALGEEEEEDEDEEEVDYVEELGLKDMEPEELAEILAENGLSTKGKKQALIDRIVTAIEDGTIELDDEEEGE
jgi:SAP domain